MLAAVSFLAKITIYYREPFWSDRSRMFAAGAPALFLLRTSRLPQTRFSVKSFASDTSARSYANTPVFYDLQKPGQLSLPRTAGSEAKHPRRYNHQTKREQSDSDLADESDRERSQPLLAHIANVRAQAHARESQQKRPAR